MDEDPPTAVDPLFGRPNSNFSWTLRGVDNQDIDYEDAT
jgi:hypothetical protein